MRSRRAFTLVELLVVIGVIAILIGILLPALYAARESARTTICLSNIRQLAVANLAYTSEYGRYLPYSQFGKGMIAMNGQPIGVNVRWCWADDTSGDPVQALKYGMISKYLSDVTAIAGCPSFETPEQMIKNY